MSTFNSRAHRRKARERLRASNWPTLPQLRHVTAMLTADTILQVLKGEGYYYGPDGETQHHPPSQSLAGYQIYRRESPLERRWRVTGVVEA